VCEPGTILFLATHPWVYEGGSEFLWQQTAKVLRQQGVPVAVCLHDYGPLPAELEALRELGAIFHFRRPYDPRDERQVTLPAWRAWCLRRGWHVDARRFETMDWIRTQDPALVIVNQAENKDGAWWMQQLHYAGRRYVTLTHNGGPFLWPNEWEVDMLTDGLRSAQQNYFVSEANRRSMERHLALELWPARIVRNPFQVSYHPQVDWPEETGEMRLAMVGRIDPKAKGHDLALEVLALPVWRQRRISLTVFGHGQNENSIRRLAQRFQLTNVTFAGFTRDVQAIWRRHHVLFQPSRFEGLPIVLVEAMLCRRSAVVTDVGGQTELIEDNVNGFVARTPTVSDLHEALERCWHRRAELAVLGQAARETVVRVIPEKPAEIFAQELLELRAVPRRA
jgi:glycosyltransferase involved in cell wall biosynthesis